MFTWVHSGRFLRRVFAGAVTVGTALAAATPGVMMRIDGIRAALRAEPLQALSDARDLAKDHPEIPEARLLLGEAHLKLAQLDAAQQEFEAAQALDASLARTWLGLGRVAEARFELQRAIECYERAHALDSTDPDIELAARRRARRLSVPWASANESDPEHGNWQLVSETARATIRLERVMNPGNINGWGVSVSFNQGKPMRLLLDTGATGIMLSRDLLEKAQLEPSGRGVIRGVGEQHGFRAVEYGRAQSVRIGPIEFRNALVQVAARDSLVGLDGLIGTDVFAHFIVTMDFLRRELRLDPPELEDRSEYNGYVPVLRQGHALLMPLVVDGQQECLFQIDTGANSSFVSSDLPALSDRLMVEPGFRVRGASGHVGRVYRAEHVRIEFAGIRRLIGRLLSIDFRPQNAYRHFAVHGILGLPELSDFRLSIDYGQGRVRLEPAR